MTDLDDLARLARAATPGPWEADCCSAANMVYGQVDSIGVDATEDDALFIAAANPETVLALVERVRKAESERDEAVSKAMVWAKSCADANERAERAEAERDEFKRLFSECHPVHLDGLRRAERAEAEVAFLKENRLPGLEADAAALDRAEAVIAEAAAKCYEPDATEGDVLRILSGYEP